MLFSQNFKKEKEEGVLLAQGHYFYYAVSGLKMAYLPAFFPLHIFFVGKSVWFKGKKAID